MPMQSPLQTRLENPLHVKFECHCSLLEVYWFISWLLFYFILDFNYCLNVYAFNCPVFSMRSKNVTEENALCMQVFEAVILARSMDNELKCTEVSD